MNKSYLRCLRGTGTAVVETWRAWGTGSPGSLNFNGAGTLVGRCRLKECESSHGWLEKNVCMSVEVFCGRHLGCLIKLKLLREAVNEGLCEAKVL